VYTLSLEKYKRKQLLVSEDEDGYTLMFSLLKAEKSVFSNNIALSITKGNRPANMFVVSLET
jgi:hypothetical protein